MSTCSTGLAWSNSVKMGSLNKTQTFKYDSTTNGVLNYKTSDIKRKYKKNIPAQQYRKFGYLSLDGASSSEKPRQ